MRLSTATLGALRPEIETPAYDRAAQACGIVHFGVGAFHRAHQAFYTDQTMTGGDRDWAILGVSPRSARAREQLEPQDGLYSVTERSPAGDRTRVIGSLRGVIVAPREPEAVIAAIASPETQIISFTITEKGYRPGPDNALGNLLVAGLARRCAAGLAGVTLISCDNRVDNGGALAALVGEAVDRSDRSLQAWFDAECTCPSTMVDRIAPATTADDLARIADTLGLRDDAAVVTEPFNQWVIEDWFAGRRPRWEVAGAQFTNNIRAFETAKLRMLNGAHSALAYLGLARGWRFVHEAVADPKIAPVIDDLIRREAATSFAPPADLDLAAYADALLARFRNSALPHRLSQIAMDGSQKIPQRWLDTLARAEGLEAHRASVEIRLTKTQP